MYFYWNVLPSVHACHCSSVATFCLRFTPVMRFSRNVLRSVHACCLTLSAKQDGLRYLAFLFRGSRSPFARSRGALRLSAFVGSLRVWLFLYGDLDEVTTGVGYTKRNAVFVQRSFCYKFMIRNDTAGNPLGLRAPNLRQRVFDSLDSLHAAAGLGWCGFAPPSPGHNRRPA